MPKTMTTMGPEEAMAAVAGRAVVRLLSVVVLLGAALPALAQGAGEASLIARNRTDAWLASFAIQLQLGPAQEAAFAGYAAAIRAQAQAVTVDPVRDHFVNTASLPAAPEALAARIAVLEQRLAALKAVAAAAGQLYADLSPQQRITFDFLALTPTGVGGSDVP